MADEEIIGKSLGDLIFDLHQDIQAAAEAIAGNAQTPAAATPRIGVTVPGAPPITDTTRTAAPSLPVSDTIFIFNAVEVNLKTAFSLEPTPGQTQPRLIASPVGLRVKPPPETVSSVQISFAPLPRPAGGPPTISVPEVRQRRWTEAIALIQNAGLIVGSITEKVIPGILPGTVFSQQPAAGTLVAARTPVDLVVATEVVKADTVAVPNVVGLALTNATQIINGRGLKVGQVIEQSSSAPAGTIIQQSPNAGQQVLPGTAVDLVLAKPSPVAVPNVIGLTLAKATKQITGSGLTVGKVKNQQSNAQAGTVIQQSPNAGQQVAAGTAVDLVIAEATGIAVPNVVGLTLEKATEQITGSGLIIGQVTFQQAVIAPGRTVIQQSPNAGQQVAAGTAVDLVIAGVPPVAVPNVVGLTLAKATKQLTGSGLKAGAVRKQLSNGLPGAVLDQSPAAGSQVAPETLIDLVVDER